MKRRVNLMLLGFDHEVGLAVIKGLRCQKEFDVRVVTVGPEDSVLKFFSDAHYGVSPISSDEQVRLLLDIAWREGVDIIFPTSDEELIPISRSIREFEKKGIKVPISDEDTLIFCLEKDKTYQIFRYLNVPTPETFIPTGREEEAEAFPYPLVFKPRRGTAAKGIVLVEDPVEFRFYVEKMVDPIAQEFVEGEEFTVDVLCDMNGRVLGMVQRKRLEVLAGASIRGVTFWSDEVEKYVRLILERLKVKGPANVQGFLVGGSPVFTEVNPRFSRGLPLSIAAGFNIPLLLLRLLILGDAGELPHPRKGVYMYRYSMEIFVTPEGTVIPDIRPEAK